LHRTFWKKKDSIGNVENDILKRYDRSELVEKLDSMFPSIGEEKYHNYLYFEYSFENPYLQKKKDNLTYFKVKL
jgi:hypothetical protein